MRAERDTLFHLAMASVENFTDTIFWLDKNARIVFANAAASRTLGYSNETLLGMTIHDIDRLFPPEAWPPHAEELKRKGSMRFKSKHWAHDGRMIPVEVTCNYFEFDGEFYSFAFNRDISERQAHEDRLKLTQFAVDRMSDSMLWLDESAKVYYANDSACKALGYAREELLQKHIFDIDPDFPPT